LRKAREPRPSSSSRHATPRRAALSSATNTRRLVSSSSAM
jgi:hypothetical protein